MNETQKTIATWADKTFGPATSNMTTAARANVEMAELMYELCTNDMNPKAPAEMADVVIVMCRIAEKFGVDIWNEVEKKMKINRARTWARDGFGHGQHVKEDSK